MAGLRGIVRAMPVPPLHPASLDWWIDFGIPRADAGRCNFDAVADYLRRERVWAADGVRIEVDEPVIGTGAPGLAARSAFTWTAGDGRSGSGAVDIAMARDGWVRVDVAAGGFSLRMWHDRVWEEHEFWPDGADTSVRSADPPGRGGKRGNWIQIDTEHWPQLQRYGRYLSIETPEA